MDHAACYVWEQKAASTLQCDPKIAIAVNKTMPVVCCERVGFSVPRRGIQITINLNTPARSLKGIPVLFEDPVLGARFLELNDIKIYGGIVIHTYTLYKFCGDLYWPSHHKLTKDNLEDSDYVEVLSSVLR